MPTRKPGSAIRRSRLSQIPARQISHYLARPRRYRHRYLDGWQEKDTRAAMLFGRAFEKAVAAYFRREDAAAAFFTEWSTYRDGNLVYSGNDTSDRLLQEGFQLLDRLAQEDRVRVPRPRRNQQIKFSGPISSGNDLVAYVDAIGRLDGIECLIEWKTTSARYPEEPDGLLALDPQLVCYSWITGISEIAQVVFVRNRLVDVQYLRTTITEAQRQEFAACSFDEFLERRFPDSRRTAYYLMSIHEHLPPQVSKELKQVGWTKAAELTKVARSDGQDFDCAAWMHKARSLPRDEFKREVDKHLTGKDSEPTEVIYFKLYRSQIPVVGRRLKPRP